MCSFIIILNFESGWLIVTKYDVYVISVKDTPAP